MEYAVDNVYFFSTRTCSNWCLFLRGIYVIRQRQWLLAPACDVNKRHGTSSLQPSKVPLMAMKLNGKHLLQSILSGYLNSRAIICLKSTRARRADRQLVVPFWTSPCISNGASGCSQFVIVYRLVLETVGSGEFQMAISWRRWMERQRAFKLRNSSRLSYLLNAWLLHGTYTRMVPVYPSTNS